MSAEPTKLDAINQIQKEINTFYRKEGKLKHDVLYPASQIKIDFISTGSLALDRALGGGFARGRSVELLGELSTLKTSFAMQGIANAQEAGMVCAFYDVEGTFDGRRAELLGVELEELQMIERALRGDEALDVVCSLLDQGNFFVVIDSVAALLPKEEAVRRLGEDTVGRQASLMSRAMRKITQANRDGCVVFINQLRENIGITFGPRTKGPGGKALGFYATHRVRFTRIETLKSKRTIYVNGKPEEKDVETAWRIQAKIEKSKVGRPLREAVFLFDLDTGMVDNLEELLNLSLEYGLIKPDGPQHFVVVATGERVRWRQGILNVIENDPDQFYNELVQLINAAPAKEPTQPPDDQAAPEPPEDPLAAVRALLPNLSLPAQP
jgi:recombination protein RecA